MFTHLIKSVGEICEFDLAVFVVIDGLEQIAFRVVKLKSEFILFELTSVQFLFGFKRDTAFGVVIVLVGYRCDGAVYRAVCQPVTVGKIFFFPRVGDKITVFVVFGQIVYRIRPTVSLGQRYAADRLAAVAQLDHERGGPDVIEVVMVVPDLLHRGGRLFRVDDVVSVIIGDVSGYRVFDYRINDLDVFFADKLILVEVGERPAPVGSGGDDNSSGVRVVRVQMYGHAVGTGLVRVLTVVPDLFALDLYHKSVRDLKSVDRDAARRYGIRLNLADISTDRVFGNGVFDLVFCDLLRRARAVFAQMLERVVPSAVIVRGNSYGLGQDSVRVEVDYDVCGTRAARVVVVEPDFFNGDVYIRRNVSVDDFDIAVLMLDVFGIVAFYYIFLKRVDDLVSVLVVFGEIVEAPLPVVFRGDGDAVDLSRARHEIYRYALGADATGVAVVVPDLETVLVDVRGSVRERYRRVFVLFNGLGRGRERDVRNGVFAGGGSHGLIGDYRVARDVAGGRLGHGVSRALGEVREFRGLAVREDELYKARAVRQTGESELGSAHRVFVGGAGGESVELDREDEFRRIRRACAFKNFHDLEAAEARFLFGVLYGDERDVCFLRLSALRRVGHGVALHRSFDCFVVEPGVGDGACALVGDHRQTGDVKDLVLGYHHGADAVCERHVAERAVDVGGDLGQSAVGVKRYGYGELACKILSRKRCVSFLRHDLLYIESGRGRRRILVVLDGDRDGRCRGIYRSGAVVYRRFVTLRIGLGDGVGHADRKSGERYRRAAAELDVSFAVLERYVAVGAVERGVAEFDMNGKLGLFITFAGDFLLYRQTCGLFLDLCVLDLYGVFAAAEIYESVGRGEIGGGGLYRAALLIYYRYRVVDAGVGLPTGQHAFPEVVGGVNVVYVEGVAPRAVVVLYPLVRIAYLAYET